MNKAIKITRNVALTVGAIVCSAYLAYKSFLYFDPVFGARNYNDLAFSIHKMEQSPHYQWNEDKQRKEFTNLEPVLIGKTLPVDVEALKRDIEYVDYLETQMDLTSEERENLINGKSGGLLKFVTTRLLSIEPEQDSYSANKILRLKKPLNLDTAKFNREEFEKSDTAVSWFGHSSILLKIDGKTVLSDPVFYEASPLSAIMKPFNQKNPLFAKDMPAVDYLIITHDHYDHLDMKTIKDMDRRGKVKKFIVPLGVGSHLIRFGVDSHKIVELDWFETYKGDIDLTLTPAKHYSGRTFENRNMTLWGSYVIESDDKKIFINGDSGYGKHYQMIQERFGEFDLVFMESGAYNQNWNSIHLLPLNQIKAIKDLKAKKVIPVHWGKFDLAYHEWKDSINKLTYNLERLEKEENIKIDMIVPKQNSVINPFEALNLKEVNQWFYDHK